MLFPVPTKTKHRNKLREFFGQDIPKDYSDVDKTPVETKPWYLQSNYNQTDILIDPDGSVKGGTVPALVERLTPHENGGRPFKVSIVMLMLISLFTTRSHL